MRRRALGSAAAAVATWEIKLVDMAVQPVQQVDDVLRHRSHALDRRRMTRRRHGGRSSAGWDAIQHAERFL
jgi:hypothetical protein